MADPKSHGRKSILHPAPFTRTHEQEDQTKVACSGRQASKVIGELNLGELEGRKIAQHERFDFPEIDRQSYSITNQHHQPIEPG